MPSVPSPTPLARLRALGEIVLAVVGLFAASIAISLGVAPFLPEAFRMPALAMAMWGAVSVGWLLLRASKSSYRALGFAWPKHWRRTLLWTLVAIAAAEAGAIGINLLLAHATDWPPLDASYIRDAIEGDALAYVVWIVFVVWGSAGFGEELFGRGFAFDRFQILFGRKNIGLIVAALAQAALFGWLHALQGPSGIVLTAYVGLVFAAVYLASGRNLWTVILAHGLVDTFALTMMFLGYKLPGIE